MVYINKQSGTISIPRHTHDFHGKYKMKLSSNMSDEVWLVDSGSNISTNLLYYKFELGDLDALNVGEYAYQLTDLAESLILEEGLLTFGEYKREVVENNSTRNKIQYNG